MKEPYTEPLIALFFKALAIIFVLTGLYMALTKGLEGIVALLSLILGAAPCAWWMGEIIGLLGRIAANLESGPLENHAKPARASKPSKQDLESMIGGGMRSVNRDADDDTPRYSL